MQVIQLLGSVAVMSRSGSFQKSLGDRTEHMALSEPKQAPSHGK